MNIVLMGFMGSGKTAVGEILAKRLGWGFYDTDAMIEKDAGKTISQIFEAVGDEAFRAVEKKTVSLVALLEKAVIATGGGVPLDAENLNELRRNGKMFVLTARPETVFERVKDSLPERPLLAGADPFSRVVELLKERGPVYGKCGQVIATDGLSPEQVVEKIVAHLPKNIV